MAISLPVEGGNRKISKVFGQYAHSCPDRSMKRKFEKVFGFFGQSANLSSVVKWRGAIQMDFSHIGRGMTKIFDFFSQTPLSCPVVSEGWRLPCKRWQQKFHIKIWISSSKRTAHLQRGVKERNFQELGAKHASCVRWIVGREILPKCTSHFH